MNKLQSAIINIAFLAPVILFIINACIIGIPSQTVVSVETFRFQYIMTLLTIIMIPALLWLVRKDRIKDEKKYTGAVIARMMLFMVLVLVDIYAFFMIPNAAFFYLAVITYLSMFFARR